MATRNHLMLTPRGVRQALYDLINDDGAVVSRPEDGTPVMRRWLERDLVARMAHKGATKRQVINALLKLCDWGDMLISMEILPSGAGEPEYRLDPKHFTRAA